MGLFIDATGSHLFGGYVMKTDVWDRRHVEEDPLKSHFTWHEIRDAARRNDVKKLRYMASKESEDYKRKISEGTNLPHPEVLGQVIITLSGGVQSLNDIKDLQPYEQRLSLYDAVATTKYGWRGIVQSHLCTFVHSQKNLLVIRCRDESERDILRSVVLSRSGGPGEPRSGCDSDCLWIDHTFPDGFRYVMAARITGTELTASIGEEKAVAQLTKSKRYDFVVYAAAATNMESPDPLERAKQILREAVGAGYGNLLVSHKSWWHSFWRHSFIDIENKEIENAWYLHSYLLACLSRGKTPPGVGGLWTAKAELPWGGKYIDAAYCLMYTSCFAANQLELAEPFWRFCEGALEGAKENAKVLFGCQGARFHHGGGHDGLETELLWYRLETYVSAFVGLIHWWGYLYSQDEEFLRRVYPLMKETALFYEGILEKDSSNGKYFLPGPMCPLDEMNSLRVIETKNSIFDLAMVKRLFVSVVEASAVLSVDDKKRKEWQHIIENLSDLPSDGEIFLNYENEDPRHTLLLAICVSCIYPAQAVSLDDPRCLRTINDNWRRLAYTEAPQAFSWPWLAASAAWIGRGDIAVQALHNQMRHHMTPNGIAVEGIFGHSFGDNPSYLYGRLIPFISTSEVSFFFSAAVNEMLLQSLYDGVIKVFKGVPRRLYEGNSDLRWEEAGADIYEKLNAPWKARFANLRAAGAFLVSAERVNGEVRYVSLKSLAGKECKLEIPEGWDVGDVRVREIGTTEVIPAVIDDRVIRFKTGRDTTYVVDRKNSPFEHFPHQTLSGEARQKARKYLGIPG
jgi:hypothetical protein